MGDLIQVEYIGFTPRPAAREYLLRARRGTGDFREFSLLIPNEAFLAGRVRYQDAPEICFLKLHRELLASQDGGPPAGLTVTDDDLAQYRATHAPKTPQRRPKPLPGAELHPQANRPWRG